ncbi:nucleoid-associated protein [Bacillus mojavensis]|uniref:Nucleoid-associated protein n=1 Tax=Bacillus mojavensis TaxID=72360 RepID=A0AAP3CUF1_BACMO|nr:nucleoid-associated protein [Bacillus mojavensis]MCY8104843.1 nucleoid-associated protein [Bacillus mojavensis]MCY8482060.1 nucleoid-associated protein [Bacillus mojavensis]MCY8510408.1 nucleoid-associated protein [Bacillus mojavensis]MEC1775894.1 nucleoid-associated protein [Bacillus mojavensis]
MIDLSKCELEKAIIHYIANPLEKVKSVISNNVIDDNVLFQKPFLKLSFNKFEENEICEFTHESEINLNEVYFFSSQILKDGNDFITNSQNIAKHLIEVSRHPNIKGGELLILKFKGARYEDKEVEILSIVKVEDKEQFLQVNNLNEKLTISSFKGIDLKQNNKLGLIMFFKEKSEFLVFVNNRKKDDAVFWKENFLNVKYKVDDRYKTEHLLKECRHFISNSSEFSPEEKVEYLSKSIEFFKEETYFDTEKYFEKVFKEKNVDIDYLHEQIKPLETHIAPDTVRKVEKKFVKTIVLDDDIKIRISMGDIGGMSDILEKGFDVDKNKRYYKIYFEEEK